MAKLFDIQRVSVGPANLDALVEVLPDAPFFTGDDPAGTDRVMALMPSLADHLCLGDSSGSFGAVVDDTELAHLLEHVTVELIARTGLGNEIESGRTTRVGTDSFVVRLACPDDVLVCGALSSAVWILEWAYSGGGDPAPDVDAVVAGLVELVASVSESALEDEGQAESEAFGFEPEPDFEQAEAAEDAEENIIQPIDAIPDPNIEAEIDMILAGEMPGAPKE